MWQFIALEVKGEGQEKGIYSSINFKRGEDIFELRGPTSKASTRTSIKISDKTHIEDNFGRFINHSCNPSVKIDGRVVVALKNISRGEEITFDYLDNEDTLASPFICSCCGKSIS